MIRQRFLFIWFMLIAFFNLNNHLFGASLILEEENAYITTRKIPSLEKLPLSAIHRIFQDSDGFMWYGTFDGLCRYDGYNVKVFRSDFNSPGLLRDNYITYIQEGKDGNIYIGTLKGGYLLDKEDYSITPIDLGADNNKNVFTISVTNDGLVWISVPGTLYQLDKSGKVSNSISTKIDGRDCCAYFVYKMPTGELITSLDGLGMYEINLEKGKLSPFYSHPYIKNIERILYDEKNHCYWLATWGHGIVRFDPYSEDKSRIYEIQASAEDALGSKVNNIFHIVQDNNLGYIWATTEQDLFAFEITDEKRLTNIHLGSLLANGNKKYYEIFKDQDGSLWVSSFNTPSFIVDFEKSGYVFDPIEKFRKKYQNIPLLLSMVTSTDGLKWFSQEGYGLFVLTSDGELIHDMDDGLEDKIWKTPILKRSKNREIWATTLGAEIYKLAVDRNKITEKGIVDLSIVSDNPGYVNALIEDKTGVLWIGCDRGLFKYNPIKKETYKLRGIDGKITSVIISEDGSLWVSAENEGIYRISGLSVEKHQINKNICKLDSTSDGMIWFSSADGNIYSYDPSRRKLKVETSRFGLDGERINDLVVDIFNHVWIASNQFVREFNPDNGAFRTYSTYNEKIPLDRFTENTMDLSPSGKIYVGGVGGFMSFSASQMLGSLPSNPETHITDLLINGKSRLGKGIIKKDGKVFISLSPEDSNIEIQFSSLHYRDQDQIRYAYRMKGVDDEWVYVGSNRNTAFYNHLKAGKNVFEVKSTDNKGLWSEKVTTLIIDRQPYFYETIWAKLIFVLFLIGMVFFIIQYLHKVQRHKELRQRLKELLEERTEKVSIVRDNDLSKRDIGLSTDKRFIQMAVSAVENNLGNVEFDVMALSSELNMSKATLSRRLKNACDQTPAEFIREIRLHHASVILQDPSISISEVADAVGYSDQRHFSSLFKSRYGMTPSQYQIKVSKNEEGNMTM